MIEYVAGECDVTPATLITAIITNVGVAEAPYDRSLAALADKAKLAFSPL